MKNLNLSLRLCSVQVFLLSVSGLSSGSLRKSAFVNLHSLFILPFIFCLFPFVFASAQGTLDSGLVAHYPFNGNANDESGNGNNGTVNGATLTMDRFGNATYLPD